MTERQLKSGLSMIVLLSVLKICAIYLFTAGLTSCGGGGAAQQKGTTDEDLLREKRKKNNVISESLVAYNYNKKLGDFEKDGETKWVQNYDQMGFKIPRRGTFDNNDRVVIQHTGYGAYTFKYDKYGNLIAKVIYGSPRSWKDKKPTRQMSYRHDRGGRITRIELYNFEKQQKEYTNTFQYDKHDNKAQVTIATHGDFGSVIENIFYEYDENGRLKKSYNPKNQYSTIVKYDAKGLISEEIEYLKDTPTRLEKHIYEFAN